MLTLNKTLIGIAASSVMIGAIAPVSEARAIQDCDPDTGRCQFVMSAADETGLRRGSGRLVGYTPIDQDPNAPIVQDLAFQAPPSNPCDPRPGERTQCTGGGSRV